MPSVSIAVWPRLPKPGWLLNSGTGTVIFTSLLIDIDNAFDVTAFVPPSAAEEEIVMKKNRHVKKTNFLKMAMSRA
ncbi:MAG TPA: hypothetical protein PLT05_00545 [bacterium]|nr:hypothetical protein [bacterium]